MRVITGPDELAVAVGEDLGVSSWHDVTQERVDAFAEDTGDRYWLHTDPERAKATPMGSTIAHGLYTLSLGPAMMYELVRFDGFDTGVNYGYDRVRFPAPLPVGSRLRVRMRIATVEPARNGVTVHLEQRFEREGSDRPVCVADLLVRLLGPAPPEPETPQGTRGVPHRTDGPTSANGPRGRAIPR